jgi:hypothetical protein
MASCLWRRMGDDACLAYIDEANAISGSQKLDRDRRLAAYSAPAHAAYSAPAHAALFRSTANRTA